MGWVGDGGWGGAIITFSTRLPCYSLNLPMLICHFHNLSCHPSNFLNVHIYIYIYICIYTVYIYIYEPRPCLYAGQLFAAFQPCFRSGAGRRREKK